MKRTAEYCRLCEKEGERFMVLLFSLARLNEQGPSPPLLFPTPTATGPSIGLLEIAPARIHIGVAPPRVFLEEAVSVSAVHDPSQNDWLTATAVAVEAGPSSCGT